MQGLIVLDKSCDFDGGSNWFPPVRFDATSLASSWLVQDQKDQSSHSSTNSIPKDYDELVYSAQASESSLDDSVE